MQKSAQPPTQPPSFRGGRSPTWESVLLYAAPRLHTFPRECGLPRRYAPRNDSGSGEPPHRFQHHPSPRRALPLLGEVPSAHTGERGLRGRTRCRREKTGRSADNSFSHWQSLGTGALSVTFGDSSPKGGAKGGDEKPSPRRALPLLGEVPSAHTGERGLRGRTRCRWEKTGRSADYSFPYWQFLGTGDPLRPRCARPPLPKGEARAWTIIPRPAGRCPF